MQSTTEEIAELLRDALRRYSTAELTEAAEQDAVSRLIAKDPAIVREIEVVLSAPRRASKARVLDAYAVASLLYPCERDASATPGTPLPIVIRYESAVVSLRRHCLSVREKGRKESERLAQIRHEKWGMRPWRGPKDDPVTAPRALPMPVEIATVESLAPLFGLLKSNKPVVGSLNERDLDGIEDLYGVPFVECSRGILFSDGRMDLCKQVVGPTHIDALMAALESNQHIRHFLLGNNIVGQAGAERIAAFIKKHPDRMRTWYLAGNCLDLASIAILADAWEGSPAVEALWLKRNPVRAAGVESLASWLASTGCNLTVLDLDQAEIGDAGCKALFAALPCAKMRTIYISANGITAAACEDVGQYLGTPDPTLQNLFMSLNAIGDAGAKKLALGLAKNRTLQRLALASCGLTSPGIVALAQALSGHPALLSLSLDQSYSTQDLDQRLNYIPDQAAEPLAELVRQGGIAPLLALRLGTTAISTGVFIRTLAPAVAASPHIVHFTGVPRRTPGGRDSYSRSGSGVTAALERNLCALTGKTHVDYDEWVASPDCRRVLNDPEAFRTIDSVYRNRDTNNALRGESVLNKWWKSLEELETKSGVTIVQ